MLMLILKLNHKKKCIQLLTFLLLFSLLMSVGVACLHPQIVFAATGFQVGAVILAMLQALGQTPSTTAITNYMQNNAVLSQTITSAEQIDGIASAIDQALSADLGTARLTAQLSNSSTDMTILKENLITAGADPLKVNQLPSGGATAGQNVEAVMKEYFNNGQFSQSYGGKTLSEVGLQSAFGMTALAYEGAKLGNFQAFQEYARAAGLTQAEIDAAVDSGAAFGDPSAFADYIKEYRKSIFSGADIDTSSSILSQVPDGYYYATVERKPSPYYTSKFGSLYLPKGVYGLIIKGSGLASAYNANNYSCIIKYAEDNNSFISPNQNKTIAARTGPDIIIGSSQNGTEKGNNLLTFNSINEFNNFKSNLQADGPSIKTPSVTGNNGQLQSQIDSSQNVQPYVINIYPTYNTNNYNINELPGLDDYSSLVQLLQDNLDQGLPTDNIIEPFIEPYLIQREESVPENPDNPENPVDPDRLPTVPYPDPELYPDAIPELSPVPDEEIAPENIPTPTPIEPTDKDVQDVNSKLPAFNLADKFPFCLPFDIHKALTLLKGSREAPYFVWTMPFGDAGEQTVTVDLSPWDEVAQILRVLELLLFIVGLAVATRNLLGGE